MAKREFQDNFRVVVEMRAYGAQYLKPDSQRRAYEAACEAAVDEIKRHVDNVRDVYVESDTARECEYCGAEWTQESDTYNGGCCRRDELDQIERGNEPQ